MQASQPVTKDAAPAIRGLAREWLYDNSEAILDNHPCGVCAVLNQPCACPLPQEWIDDLAAEFEAALEDRGREWLEKKS